MIKQGQHLYEFGPFQLDPVERLLTRDGQPVPLTPRAFEALLVLIRKSGHLVAKDELMKSIWGDSFVEEGNLAVTISMVRKALAEDGAVRKYVQTVSKSGYRFVGDVHELEVVEPGPASPEETPPLAEPSRTPAPSRRWVLLAGPAIVLAIAAIALAIGLFRTRAPAVSPGVRSLAVLPFHNLGESTSRDYLGVGIADALITKLGNTGQIIVRPTSAVLKYAHSLADPLAAGREQEVDAVLDGRIQLFPDRIRVTVQLVRVSDGASLWAGTFEQNPQNMSTLEDVVADRIAESMAPQLSPEEKKRLARPYTQNRKAYQLYLQGRYFWNRRTEDGLRRSISYFRQAIAEDPNYALAYAGLADAYALLSPFSVETARQASPDAKAAALKALQLDNSLAEAHASLAITTFFDEWNLNGAEHEFQRAIQLNPSYAMAHGWYGLNLAAMGRLNEALGQMRRAQDLDPLSMILNTNVGWIFYLSRRYDEAIAAYRKTLDLDPYFARTRTRLGLTYILKGAFPDAIRELDESRRLAGDDPYVAGLLGYARTLAGDKNAGRAALAKLTESARREYVPPFSVALVCIALGDNDRALEWLTKAADARDTSMVYAKTDPALDPIRSDPRFANLLRRMGF